MSWTAYALSLGVGLGVGVAYGMFGVRSPAPPIIALLGLLGMLIGETLVGYLRAKTDAAEAVSKCLHGKRFDVAASEPIETPNDRERV